MPTLIASGQTTIVDLSDRGSLNAYVASNQPRVQIYNATTHEYTPDYTESPHLVLTPSIYIDGEIIPLTSDSLSLEWKKRIGTTEYDLDTDEVVSNGILTVSGNKLNNTTSYIVYVIKVSYTDPSTEYTIETEASSDISLVTSGDVGNSAVVFTMYAPEGTVFDNQSGTKTIQTAAYYGSTVISNAEYRWYDYTSGSWTLIPGATSNNYVVHGENVVGQDSFKCIMTYQTVEYTDVITLIDKTDNYQTEIDSTAGNIIKNSIGNTYLIANLYQNGKEADPLKCSYTDFGTTPPQNPSTGDFYHKVVSGVATMPLMRYNGSTWVDVTSNPSYNYKKYYEWYRRDKDGNPLDNGQPFATGKAIFIEGTSVEEKCTFVCEVKNKSEDTDLISTGNYTVTDITDAIVSDTEPLVKTEGMIWIDTSSNPSIMKTWKNNAWKVVGDSDKSKIFTSIPVGPYNVGDMWIGRSDGEIYYCTTARQQQGGYDINDWTKASDYQTSSDVTDALADFAETVVDPLSEKVDTKIETFAQSTDPSTSWDATTKEKHLGDLWYDTTEGSVALKRYYKDTSVTPNVYKWLEVDNQSAKDALEGLDHKISTYSQENPPTGVVLVNGDIWIDTNDNNKLYRWNGTEWIDSTDDSSVQSFITETYTPDINAIKANVDSKIETWYQTTDPSAEWSTIEIKAQHIGDMWYKNTTGSVSLKRYYRKSDNTFDWQEITNQKAIDAYAAAGEAYDLADGKRRVFYGSSNPTAPYDVGDLWAQGENGELLVCKTAKAEGQSYSENDWSDSSKYGSFINVQYVADKQALQSQIDGKIQTWFQDLDPTKHAGLTKFEWTRYPTLSVGIAEDGTFENKVDASGTYVFTYNSGSWKLNDGTTTKTVNLNSYGLSITQGTPANNDTITIVYNKQEDSLPWSTATMSKHEGDLWYSPSLMQMKRLVHVSGEVYDWELIQDDTAIKAAQDVIIAQATADGKTDAYYIRNDLSYTTTTGITANIVESKWCNYIDESGIYIFTYDGTKWKSNGEEVDISLYGIKLTGNPVTGSTITVNYTVNHPNPPYDVEDIWLQGNTGEMKVCVNSKSEGQEFAESDWEVGTQLSEFINVTYPEDYEVLEGLIDNKIESWFQTTDPSTEWTTNIIKLKHVGDIWYNNTEGHVALKRYYQKPDNTFDWEEITNQDAIDAYEKAEAAQETADGKIVTFAQNDEPTAAQSSVGDLWIDTNNNNKLYRYNGTSWTEVTDASGLNNFISTTYEPFVATTTGLIQSVENQYYLSTSTTTPTGGSWQTTAPTWVDGKYMWSRTKVTDKAGNVTYKPSTNGTCIAGATGATGRSISGVTNYYLATNLTSVTRETSGWTTTVQKTDVSKKYLWNYEEVSYTSGNPTYTDPCIIGMYAESGVAGSQIWTTTTAPTTPNYTFTISNLSGRTGTTPAVGDIILYSYYRYTISSTSSTTVLSGTRTELKGSNSAPVFLYKRASSTSAPSVPSGNVTYKFSDGSVEGTLDGWTTSIPSSNGNPCYVTHATASSIETTDTISTTEWSTPTIFVENGTDGQAGYNNAVLYLYKRSAAAPSIDWTNSITYTFSTNSFTVPSGWSRSSTTGTDPLYQTTATASSRTNTDTIAYTEWSTPIKLVEDGDDGKGITEVKEYYAKSTSSTTAPADSSFSETIPTIDVNNKYLWNYEVTTYSDGSTDRTSKKVIGAHGTNGTNGTNGISITGVTNYYLATSVGSGVTRETSGWTTTIQTMTATNKYLWNYEKITYSSGNPTYTDPCIIGTFGKDGTNGTDGKGITSITEYYAVSTSATTEPTEWQTVIPTMTSTNKYLWNYEVVTYTTGNPYTSGKRVIGAYGDKGSNGSNGLNSASVILYQRGSSAPSIPSSNVTYTFSTGAISGAGNWTKAIPASDGNPCYSIQATASSTSATYSITTDKWSTPVKIVENGQAGQSGANGNNTAIVSLYKRSASAPTISWTISYTYTFSTHKLNNVPSGWSQDIPSTGTDPLYVTNATAYGNTASVTIKYTDWTTPVKLAVNGTNGRDGEDGDDGVSITGVVNHYLATSKGSGVTKGDTGWTTTIQTMTSTNKYLWNYETINYSSGSPTETDPCIIGTFGKDGINGTNGTDGKGITSITEYYAKSTSATTAPSDSSFGTDVPTIDATNKYLWNYEVITYTTGSPYTSEKRVIGAYGDKGANGINGTNGLNVASVIIYKRGTSAPSIPQETLTYTFSSGVLSGSLNGWTQYIPILDSNNSPCYSIQTTASSLESTCSIPKTSWTSPLKIIENGKNGTDGIDGVDGIDGSQFWTTTTAPTTPNYTFTISNLSGKTGTTPAVGDVILYSYYRYTISSVSSTTVNCTTRQSIRGSTGAAGANGYNTAIVYLYARGTSAPSKPSYSWNITYTFSTHLLSTVPTGWSQTVPTNNSNPLYVTTATAFSNTDTDEIESSEWTDVAKLAESGANGLNNASVFLYQRATTVPDKPSGNIIYTFATGNIEGSVGSWSKEVPTSSSNPCYIIRATASSTGATDTITPSEWSDPIKFVENGQAGSIGPAGYNTALVYLYKRSTTTPTIDWTSELTYTFSTRLLSTVPSGWKQNMSEVTGTDPLYVTTATAYSNTSTDKIPKSEWTTPVMLVENGTDGEDGIGISEIVGQYYLSTSSTTQSGGSWSESCPEYQYGKYYWTRDHITWDNGDETYTDPILANGMNYSNQQVDKKIEVWYDSTNPSSSWTTTDDKEKHLGDLWYNTTSGSVQLSTYTKNGTTYSWSPINNQDAIDAVAEVQDLNTKKRQVFIDTPIPPYARGDIWMQGENGDILYCNTARTSGSFVSTDFVIASKYKANQIYTGVSAPSDTSLLWIDNKNQASPLLKKYNSETEEWEIVGSSVKMYSSSTPPSPPYNAGDQWVYTENGILVAKICITGKESGSFSDEDWVSASGDFIIRSSEAPSDTGRLWFNISNNRMYIYDHDKGEWQELANYSEDHEITTTHVSTIEVINKNVSRALDSIQSLGVKSEGNPSNPNLHPDLYKDIWTSGDNDYIVSGGTSGKPPSALVNTYGDYTYAYGAAIWQSLSGHDNISGLTWSQMAANNRTWGYYSAICWRKRFSKDDKVGTNGTKSELENNEYITYSGTPENGNEILLYNYNTSTSLGFVVSDYRREYQVINGQVAELTGEVEEISTGFKFEANGLHIFDGLREKDPSKRAEVVISPKEIAMIDDSGSKNLIINVDDGIKAPRLVSELTIDVKNTINLGVYKIDCSYTSGNRLQIYYIGEDPEDQEEIEEPQSENELEE